jgi:hypothetical protein
MEYPNPTQKEVDTWVDVLNRCKKLETVHAVAKWARKHGIYDLLNAAKTKSRMIRANKNK